MSFSVFSVDLVQGARQHISFLRSAHREGVTLSPISTRTLDRYLNIWLPLVAAHADNKTPLVPPTDIAWLWHCHRLAPLRYEAFCLHRFGAILDPSPAFSFQSEGNVDERTVCAWTEMFPDEAVFVPTAEGCAPDAPTPEDLATRLGGFNILESARAQAGFLWQVSGPKFSEHEFLVDAVENYHKFLILSHGDLPLVPTYQIDLIWHTHMLISTSGYNRDCLSIRGSKFHHDDSLNDRTEGAKLDRSFRDTCKRWKDTYGEDYEVAGGMYRGEPEVEYYDYNVWCPSLPSPKMPESLVRATVAGASSTGSGSGWVEPGEVIGSFIRMNPRTKGANANPKLDGFVFGVGSKGPGYYSLQTKDAYEIIKVRLMKKYRYEYSKYNSFECDNCLCFGAAPSPAQIRAKDEIKARMDETKELLALVKTRLTMSGPDEKITTEKAKLNGASGTDRQFASSGTGYYDTTPTMFLVGAGCGGGVPVGGGCGGGAACGAACGGGGCGGGGCGGGG